MHKIKDILRLHRLGGLTSCRRLSRAVGCSKTAVAECLQRANAAGLTSWEVIAALDEAELELRLYPGAAKLPVARPPRPVPDWRRVREPAR